MYDQDHYDYVYTFDTAIDTNTYNTKSVRFDDRPTIITDDKAKTKKPNKVSQVNLSRNRDVRYKITQQDKVTKLKLVDNIADFVSFRALAQYIGVNVRPDICAPVQLIAPGSTPPSRGDMKTLNKVTKFLKATIDQGLNYVPLNLGKARLVLMTDASFANASGMKSQLGYILLMADDKGDCNVLHYASNRCKRVARSVMAAELFALVIGFDYAYLVRDLILELTGIEMMIEALVDSKTVFDVIAKDAKTTERRLRIDVMALRQSYDAGELEKVGWFPGEENAADPLTKYMLSLVSPLYKIMATNKFESKPRGWAASHESRK